MFLETLKHFLFGILVLRFSELKYNHLHVYVYVYNTLLVRPSSLHTNLAFTHDIPSFFNAQHSLSFLLRHRPQRISNHSALDTNTLFFKLLHLLPHSRLNRQDQFNISLSNQRDTSTHAAGTSRSTNAVNVIVRITGDVVVDDQSDFWDIQTTGCHISSHKDPGGLGTESRKIAHTI